MFPIYDFKSQFSNCTCWALTIVLLMTQVAIATAQEKSMACIVFFGDSLTAGYGLAPEQAYPALIEQKILADQLPYEVIPAGLSGETTAGGLRRINWILKKTPVDIFILALGSNDGLRGVEPSVIEHNLQSMIVKVKTKNPNAKIVITGLQMSPNLGQDYVDQFNQIFPRLAVKNNATLIPFLLEGVAGTPAMNLADGIHPNVEGHQIIANNVWNHLRPLLNE